MNPRLKCALQIVNHPKCISGALLFLRLVVGIAFLYHGWGKIQSPFSWMPEQAPVHVPGIFQFLAAVSEFGGGLALVLGFMTTLAMVGLSFTMLVAVGVHAFVLGDPFVNLTGGSSFEPALSYFAIAVVMMAIGPGKFSLDSKIWGEK